MISFNFSFVFFIAAVTFLDNRMLDKNLFTSQNRLYSNQSTFCLFHDKLKFARNITTEKLFLKTAIKKLLVNYTNDQF